MSLNCAISGEIPEDPVVSVKSGHVFERRLIEKYIQANGKCPITGTDLSMDDIISLNKGKFVKPRAPSATSIPSMLALFQSEWDAVVLEAFTLKQQLEQTRQELARTLYQHEAACRVIARLTKERDEARDQLAKATPTPQTQQSKDDKTDSTPKGITQDVIEKMTELSTKLAGVRKQKIPVEGLVSLSDLGSFKETYSNHSLHSSSQRGITTIDVHPNEKLILTGGVDKNVVLFDREQEVIVDTLKGHKKVITDVLFHPKEDILFSAAADNTFRVWNKGENGYNTAHLIDIHKDSVSGLALHPTGDYIVSASLDSTWCFVDIKAGKVLKQVSMKGFTQGFTAVQFHPDGIIFGTGCGDSTVKIWNATIQEKVAEFSGHQGRITSLSFSENGFHLATSAEDNTVKLWDLRKLTNFKTINFEEGQNISCVAFDQSGTHLAAAGSQIKILHAPQWNEVVTLGDASHLTSDIKFNRTATKLYSAGIDRHLRIYSA